MEITLLRDVNAVRIPSGETLLLRQGATVSVTQALGGSYTVLVPDQGGLFRIAGGDADALGKELRPEERPQGGAFDEEQVWAQLRNCYDPEIPVNIVDLGLIYSLKVNDGADGKEITVQMTLTAPGCGMGPSLAADAEQRMLTVTGISRATVELVWDPPWSPDRISAAGREKLGMV